MTAQKKVKLCSQISGKRNQLYRGGFGRADFFYSLDRSRPGRYTDKKCFYTTGGLHCEKL